MYYQVFPTMKSQGAAKNEANNAAQETKPVEKIDFSKVKVEPLFEEMVDFETFSKSDFRAVKVLECEAVPKSKKLLKFVLDDGTDEKRVILSGFMNIMNRKNWLERLVSLLQICRQDQ